MGDNQFHEPRLALNRIYTRRGDGGQTSLAGGQRISKDDLRIDCYGTVDELNAFTGAARLSVQQQQSAHPRLSELGASLMRIQHELFNLGSILATLPEDVQPRQPRVTSAEIQRLEAEIDRCNEELAPLRSFVLPGGSLIDAGLHICRTVCRRAERRLVELARTEPVPEEAIQYLNRLSDALFVWSRWANHVTGASEALWEPNRAASGEMKGGSSE